MVFCPLPSRMSWYVFLPWAINPLATPYAYFHAMPDKKSTSVEAIGYVARVINANQTPDWTLPPYIVQALLLLLGPVFYAASIYMILGRMIRLLDAEKHSLIKTTRMTKIFVLGDVISLLAQAIGE